MDYEKYFCCEFNHLKRERGTQKKTWKIWHFLVVDSGKKKRSNCGLADQPTSMGQAYIFKNNNNNKNNSLINALGYMLL